MNTAEVILAKGFEIGAIDPRLFGSFLEHLGRAVYGGIYEPGHPTADTDGFRQDVLDLVAEIGVSVVRYPGGNFVSGYNWEDGIGAIENRPRRLELAWKSTETNAVGTDEFVKWCRKAKTEPMLAVNLGTRGAEAARNMVEYCNHPGGTYWSDLRRSNGTADPHHVRLWCLGNEMDGPWQMGYKTADEYGRVAAESAKLMKWTDPTIELIACGSSHAGMPSFAAWEASVLDHTYSHVEYLSLHTYAAKDTKEPETATGEFLAKPVGMENFIQSVLAICDYVKAKKRTKKSMYLAFDEWNVWYHSHTHDAAVTPWQEAPPLLEDIYTMEDALVVGSMLLTLLRHADRVKIGCIAQLVNAIAPIMTRTGGAAWRQTIFYPYLHAARHASGVTLQTIVQSPTYVTKAFGDVPLLDVVVTHDAEKETVNFFAVNRGNEPMTLNCNLNSFDNTKPQLVEHQILAHDDLLATNTEHAPQNVAPEMGTETLVRENRLTAVLPPYSWNMVRLTTRAIA